jgi:hypothetical protein
MHVLALHLTAAIGTIGAGQRADEDNVGSAAFATDMVLGLLLLCRLAARRRLLLEAIDHLAEILLRDGSTVSNNNVLFESAVRTFQSLVVDVEDQLGATLLAREDAATPGIDRPPFGLRHARRAVDWGLRRCVPTLGARIHECTLHEKGAVSGSTEVGRPWLNRSSISKARGAGPAGQ